jgi:hypothetical protein
VTQALAILTGNLLYRRQCWRLSTSAAIMTSMTRMPMVGTIG